MFAWLLLVCALVWPSLAWTDTYTFVPVMVPFAGVQDTVVTGMALDGTLVGTYSNTTRRAYGFVWRPGQSPQPLLFVTPLAISQTGETIVGRFMDEQAGGTQRGFVLRDGTFYSVHGPPPQSANERIPRSVSLGGLNPAGLIVGALEDAMGRWHGLTYDHATETTTLLDVRLPGLTRLGLTAISKTGVLLGFFVGADNVTHGLRKEGDTLTQLDAPGATLGTTPVGITDDGTIVGAADTHGFTYKDGVYTAFDVPGATLTTPFGVRSDGVIYGRFVDATHNAGFVAYPASVPVPQAAQ